MAWLGRARSPRCELGVAGDGAWGAGDQVGSVQRECGVHLVARCLRRLLMARPGAPITGNLSGAASLGSLARCVWALAGQGLHQLSVTLPVGFC